jgi:hypothetical protein
MIRTFALILICAVFDFGVIATWLLIFSHFPL